jgi:hypothetical protein
MHHGAWYVPGGRVSPGWYIQSHDRRRRPVHCLDGGRLPVACSTSHTCSEDTVDDHIRIIEQPTARFIGEFLVEHGMDGPTVQQRIVRAPISDHQRSHIDTPGSHRPKHNEGVTTVVASPHHTHQPTRSVKRLNDERC